MLKKRIGLYGLIMVAVGSCIGSGIFRTPAEVALLLPSQGLVIIVWLVGGFMALTGALTFAELGANFPGSGGIYVFLRKAYGDLPAFLFGWAYLVIVTTGSLAALSLVFADYFCNLFSLNDSFKIPLAASAVILLSVINCLGVQISSGFATVITSLKVMGILAIITVGVCYGSEFHFSFQMEPDTHLHGLPAAFGLALIGAMFSYGGFQHASFVGDEVKNANRNLPLALIIGTAIVCFCYVLINIAYMNLLPMKEFLQSTSVASDSILKITDLGALLATILIAGSVFGTISIYTLSSPRIYYAMANDGLFFQSIARIHPRTHAPVNAILLQAAIAVVILLFWKTFSDIISYVVFVDFMFLSLTAAGVFILRKKYLKTKPTTFANSLVPVLFIACSCFMLFYTLTERWQNAVAGLVLLAVGIAFYFVMKKKKPA
ncbi:MAG: amino acid permease [Bacteroidetes bacterium]|nr:amino acid permease [Bacteroidota bacterium]